MSRTLPGALESATQDDITGPFYLVALGWDTPGFYSTIGDITWTFNFLSTALDVSLGDRPRLSFFNEDLAFGNLVMAQGTAGRSVDIYEGYQNDPGHPNPVSVFSGVMGPASIGDVVTIQCKEFDPVKNYYTTPPVFRHLPKSNTRIETASGDVIVLETR